MWALKIKKKFKRKREAERRRVYKLVRAKLGALEKLWFVGVFFLFIYGWGSGCRATWHYQRGVWLPSMLVMFAFSGCQIWLWKIHKSESSAHVSCHFVLVKSKVTCCQSVGWGTLKQHTVCCKHTCTHSSKTYHTLTQLKGVKWIISAQLKRHSTFL